MTDYHPLIARAIEGLGKSTGEARRALYERARTALVTQLRAIEPALSESEITKERLALEEAIRKVEGEAARKARAEPRTQLRSDSRFEPPRGCAATAFFNSRGRSAGSAGSRDGAAARTLKPGLGRTAAGGTGRGATGARRRRRCRASMPMSRRRPKRRARRPSPPHAAGC